MNSDHVIRLLIDLARREPIYATSHWRSWLEVEDEVNRFTLKSELTDGILVPLLRELAAGSPNWDDILLLLCWRSLHTIHYQVRSYECDQLDRWSDLTWHFMEVIHRFNLAARPEYVGRKIYNDTKSGIVEQYKVEWLHSKDVRRAAAPDEEDDEPEDEVARAPGSSIEFVTADFCIQSDWTKARLNQLVEDGHLTRPQYFVLLGRHLDGQSMAELGTQLGIEEEAAKKHYQRAVEKLKKVAPNLSPYTPDTPLYPVGRIRTERNCHGR